MKNIEKVKKILGTHKPILERRFKVKNIGIFGSFVREEEGKDSDIDILVEFSTPVSFFTFLELEEYLKEKLGIDVDLVTKKGLKPDIGKRILEQVLPV